VDITLSLVFVYGLVSFVYTVLYLLISLQKFCWRCCRVLFRILLTYMRTRWC